VSNSCGWEAHLWDKTSPPSSPKWPKLNRFREVAQNSIFGFHSHDPSTSRLVYWDYGSPHSWSEFIVPVPNLNSLSLKWPKLNRFPMVEQSSIFDSFHVNPPQANWFVETSSSVLITSGYISSHQLSTEFCLWILLGSQDPHLPPTTVWRYSSRGFCP
jgi:hypothetical protein